MELMVTHFLNSTFTELFHTQRLNQSQYFMARETFVSSFTQVEN